jgi:hypothetical protein
VNKKKQKTLIRCGVVRPSGRRPKGLGGQLFSLHGRIAMSNADVNPLRKSHLHATEIEWGS